MLLATAGGEALLNEHCSKICANYSWFQNTQTTHGSKTIILCNWIISLIIIANVAGDLNQTLKIQKRFETLNQRHITLEASDSASELG